jgi:hypothetical protein
VSAESWNSRYVWTLAAAKQLKREGWYAWASDYGKYCFPDRARVSKSGTLRNVDMSAPCTERHGGCRPFLNPTRRDGCLPEAECVGKLYIVSEFFPNVYRSSVVVPTFGK